MEHEHARLAVERRQLVAVGADVLALGLHLVLDLLLLSTLLSSKAALKVEQNFVPDLSGLEKNRLNVLD